MNATRIIQAARLALVGLIVLTMLAFAAQGRSLLPGHPDGFQGPTHWATSSAWDCRQYASILILKEACLN
ncbi:MAG: hypothetical protein JJ894_06470 [Dinoroseobacter sp.]|nr:hypothetical protein [Dinoroseobacter sp.]